MAMLFGCYVLLLSIAYLTTSDCAFLESCKMDATHKCNHLKPGSTNYQACFDDYYTTVCIYESCKEFIANSEMCSGATNPLNCLAAGEDQCKENMNSEYIREVECRKNSGITCSHLLQTGNTEKYKACWLEKFGDCYELPEVIYSRLDVYCVLETQSENFCFLNNYGMQQCQLFHNHFFVCYL